MRYIMIIVAAVVLAGCRTDTVGTEPVSMEPVRTEPVGTEPTPRFKPMPPPPVAKIENLARGAKVTASSTQQEWEGEGPAASVVDGDVTTRWSSAYEDNQSLSIDLGSVATLKRVVLLWETATPASYDVAVSVDGKTWQAVEQRRGGLAGPRTDTVVLDDVTARHLKLALNVRATEYGFSLYEAEVWGSR
jgi:hypothetical protein